MSSSGDMASVIVLMLFWLVVIGFSLLATVFWIVELVDAARREFPDPNTKIIWILVLIFSHGIGALLYYFIGKSQGTLPGQRPTYYSPPPAPDQWPPPPGA